MDIYERNIKEIEDTLDWIAKNKELEASVQNSIEGMKLYTSAPIFRRPIPRRGIDFKEIEEDSLPGVSAESSFLFDAAGRLARENPGKRIGVLHFVAPPVQDGDVTNAAAEREKDLYRCSTIYPVLRSQKAKDLSDEKDGRGILYAPGIRVIRDGWDYGMLNEPFEVDVISCPPPELDEIKGDMMLVNLWGIVMSRYWNRIAVSLYAANDNDVDVLVIGPVGFGTSGKSHCRDMQKAIATTFRICMHWLDAPELFDRIVFALPPRCHEYNVFYDCLWGKTLHIPSLKDWWRGIVHGMGSI